jgi:spore maturation protein CgeB
MRIAFFGSSLVSAYWNGAATYYRGMIRALHRLGHEITFYEPDAYDRQQHRDMDDPDWAKVVVYSSDGTDAVERQLEAARSADVIVKASGVGVFDELLEAAVLDVKRPDAISIFWDVDAPATLDRLIRNVNDPFRPLIPKYDLIFTYGGGDPVVRAYKARGARECVPIYNALDSATHFPVRSDPRFEGDLGFVGNRLPDREKRVKDFFFDAAELVPHCRFVLAGSGWDDRPMPANIKYAGHLYTADHNAFNCTPRAVLNISRESMARYGFSPATRIFEASGAGACIITDAWEGIAVFLEPDKEILVCHNGEEVAFTVSGLTPGRAREIGLQARRRILAQHTYTHRAQLVDGILTGCGSSVKEVA